MKRSGFSLVELSIVLVIVGLVIGGVLVGMSMMTTARNQSIIADWQKYSSAAQNYFTKYNYWPGDDAEVYNRWTGAYAPGDGNGTFTLDPPFNDTNNSIHNLEFMGFWQHLAFAGFITGNYSGYWYLAGVTPSMPKTVIPNTYMTHFYDDTDSTTRNFFALYITGTAPTYSGGIAYPANIGTTVLSNVDALSIDIKIDDGIATLQTGYTGNVVAKGASCNYANTSSSAKNCNLEYIYKK